MHAKWSEVIKDRTSNQTIHDSVISLLSQVIEYEDSSDYRGIKSGIAKGLTDWAVSEVRIHGVNAADVFIGSPFTGFKSILELMPVAQKHRLSILSQYTAPLIADDEEVAQTFEDGVTISRVVSKEAENILVEKSLRTFVYERHDVRRRPGDDPKCFWLVRSHGGQKLAIFETSGNTVNGMRLLGRTRASPHAHVLAFARDRELALLSPATLPGVVLAHDGSVHPILRMPDGITIDGDLEIFSRYPTLDYLPDNLTIRGNLDINDCKNLKYLPSGLTVRGDLSIGGCDELRSIGKNLYVEGDASFTFCRSLKFIQDGGEFGGDLHLHNRKLLRCKFKISGDVLVGISKETRRVAYPRSIFARLFKISE
jgi:hypothetical protein